MRVGIDAGALQTPGGVRRYLVSLLEAMRRVAPDLGFVLWGEETPGSFARLYREQLAIPNRARRGEVDLVHGPKNALALRRLSLPAVATVHDLLPLTQSHTETLAARAYWRMALAGVARNASQVIAVSRYSRDAFLFETDFAPERVVVVPHGCSPAFGPQPPERLAAAAARYGIERPYLLTVATRQPRKNHAAVLEAFARLVRRGYPGMLVLAGRAGWMWRSAARLAERLGISSRVRWTGFVAEEDLPALYAGADLFLYPSLAEGFGLPPLEAAACGVPVVASRAGGLLEVLEDAALWVDPASPAEIAQAADRLLADAPLAARLSAGGRRRAAGYTWEAAAQKTVEVYRRAVA